MAEYAKPDRGVQSIREANGHAMRPRQATYGPSSYTARSAGNQCIEEATRGIDDGGDDDQPLDIAPEQKALAIMRPTNPNRSPQETT
jgi:hypothetical protein